VRDHAVVGAQALGHGLVVAQEDLQDLDLAEGAALQGLEQVLDLVGGRQQKADGRAGDHGSRDVPHVVAGFAHIQEQGVGLVGVETLGDIMMVLFDAVREAKRLMRAPQREQVLKVIREEGELFSARLRSPEAMEAFQAFFQKRKPDFSKF